MTTTRDRAVVGTIDVPANATLAEAAAAINAAGKGISATVVKLSGNEFKLQLTGSKTGDEGAFTIKSATEDDTTAGTAFTRTRPAQDATLDRRRAPARSRSTSRPTPRRRPARCSRWSPRPTPC